MNKTPLTWFLGSRKGLLTLFTFVVAAMFAGLVGLKVAQDKITTEAGLAFCGGGILAWFAIAFKAIDAIEKEDSAAKASGPIAAGGNVVIEAKKEPTS